MKRKTTIIYSSLTLLMVLPFYLPGLDRAADGQEVPTKCTLYDFCNKPTGYSLEIAPNANKKWPYLENGLNKWAYKLNGLDKKYVLQMNTLAPVCTPPIAYSTDSGGKVYNPGAGVPLTFFGYGDFQDYAVSFPVKNGSPYSFSSNHSSPPQKTSFQINSLKGMFFCKEIAGPSCPNPLITSAASTFEEIYVNNNNDRVCLKKDPNFPCPVAVCCEGDESCTPAPGETERLPSKSIDQILNAAPLYRIIVEESGYGDESDPSVFPGEPLPVGYGGVPEQACPKIVLSVASVGKTWVCVGGTCFYR
jgi:hypothetical protein